MREFFRRGLISRSGSGWWSRRKLPPVLKPAVCAFGAAYRAAIHTDRLIRHNIARAALRAGNDHDLLGMTCAMFGGKGCRVQLPQNRPFFHIDAPDRTSTRLNSSH